MFEDYRSIPLEVLRDFARSQSEITSIRKAAKEAGISHSAFHLFVQGRTNPHPRVRRLVGLWFLRKQHEAPDIDVVRPYVISLGALLAEIPETDRAVAEAACVAALCSIYDACNAPRPRWLELLSEHYQQG